jgi:single-strand DNA-binding protein
LITSTIGKSPEKFIVGDKGEDMNNVNLIGRLTRDPELYESATGISVAKFTVAVDDFHAKDDRADFLRVVTFGKQAENCTKYLKKGLNVGVSGRLKSDSYEDKEGNKKYVTDIIADRVQFLEWPSDKEAKEKTEKPKKAKSA